MRMPLLKIFKINSQCLGCRKWGCNKWGLKGCLAALPGNQPKSTFFAIFLPFSPFSGGCEQHLGNPENEEKDLFPQISSDLLKPPSLKPPVAALQNVPENLFFGPLKNHLNTLKDSKPLRPSCRTLTACSNESFCLGLMSLVPV